MKPLKNINFPSQATDVLSFPYNWTPAFSSVEIAKDSYDRTDSFQHVSSLTLSSLESSSVAKAFALIEDRSQLLSA